MTREKQQPLIFLVDDQALLLDLAEVSLSNRGYRLRKFQDPASALQCVRKSRKKPDLLITDYAMGKMNGLDLIEQCKRVAPRLKTILVSGTMGPEIILDSPTRIDRFLGKPYQPTDLAHLVNRVLQC